MLLIFDSDVDDYVDNDDNKGDDDVCNNSGNDSDVYNIINDDDDDDHIQRIASSSYKSHYIAHSFTKYYIFYTHQNLPFTSAFDKIIPWKPEKYAWLYILFSQYMTVNVKQQ